MESATSVEDIPQWKKDLIARLRNQNKTSFGNDTSSREHHSTPHHFLAHRTVHQPNLTSKSESVASDVSSRSTATDASEQQCNVNPKMVQERVWVDNKPDHFAEMVANNGYHKDSDSDSSEELHYGPGIVKKLKNKYLSLALRESNNRPSILHMRKATSLENLLDDDDDEQETKYPIDQYESRLNGVSATRNVPNRYRNANRHHEIKRARSVEAISRLDSQTNNVVSNRQSLHEETLIAVQKEGSDYPRKVQDNADTKSENKFSQRINRPKRLQPIMSEKEKPPADFVKQAKMIFERRPEQRTKAPRQTGDVAAKVDSFNNIIVKAKVEAKVTRKPQIKGAKPVLNDKKVSSIRPQLKIGSKSEEKLHTTKPLEFNKLPKNFSQLSPIPDVSRILPGEPERGKSTSNLSETPDLILTSSPISSLHSPTNKKWSEQFVKEEECYSPKKLTSPLISPNRVKPASPLISPSYNWPLSPSSSPTKFRPTVLTYEDDSDSLGCKKVSPTSINNISKDAGTSVYNFVNKNVSQDHLPVNKNVSEVKVPLSEPLKIEVNGHAKVDWELKLLQTQRPRSPPKFTPPPPPVNTIGKKVEKNLTVTEIEKNSINVAKNKSSGSDPKESVEVVNKNVVPKKQPRAKELISNTAVFDFTSSKRDVPDYISNDKSRTPGRPELPKPGEGGIILIPGATILESFTDEDEEVLRSLEGPPSPCDVIFVNDNILIDGKSSLCQKSKRTKLKISFVDDGPEVYEYPSETSLMLDDAPLSPVQLGHTVPNLSGSSSLANYTPKSTEAFQPGITRSAPQVPPPTSSKSVDLIETAPNSELDEVDKPFSSGTNADILF